MLKNVNVFGAKASVYLKYRGTIEALGKVLSKELFLPEMSYDNDEEHPYAVYGMCETMGFSLTFREDDKITGFTFHLEIETEYSLEEAFHDRMYDLSPWLARYISRLCQIESYIEAENGSIFRNGDQVTQVTL